MAKRSEVEAVADALKTAGNQELSDKVRVAFKLEAAKKVDHPKPPPGFKKVKPKTEIAYKTFGRDGRITWKTKIVPSANVEKACAKLEESGASDFMFRTVD